MAERKSAKNLTEYMDTLDAATQDRIEFEVSVISKVIEDESTALPQPEKVF